MIYMFRIDKIDNKMNIVKDWNAEKVKQSYKTDTTIYKIKCFIK